MKLLGFYIKWGIIDSLDRGMICKSKERIKTYLQMKNNERDSITKISTSAHISR